MKSLFDELPLKERQTLARLFESDGYKLLKKVMELSRLNAAKSCLDVQTVAELKHLQGQAHGLKMLHLNLKELHKKMTKD